MSYRISREQRKANNARRYARYQSRHRDHETPARFSTRRLWSLWRRTERWEPSYSIGKKFSFEQLQDWFDGTVGMPGKTGWDMAALAKLVTIPLQKLMGNFSITAGMKRK
jgi:hypothetical protein